MRKPIVLQGSSFRLESFSEKYITDEYVSWLRNMEISKVIINANPNITLSEVRDYCNRLINSKDNYFFAIVMNEGDKHIGNVRLGPIDYNTRRCQFGMMIGDINYHGKGIGTEVVSLCIKFCFTDLDMNKLYLEVLEDNKAAIRTYEKNNLVTEKILRNHIHKNSQYFNVRLMAIVNPKEDK